MKKLLFLFLSCLSCQGAGIVSGTLSAVGSGGSSGGTVVAGTGLGATTNAGVTTIFTNGQAGGTNITVVGSTNIVFTTNQVIGTTYTNNYSVPITIYSGVAQFNSTGTGNPGLGFNGTFLTGVTISGPVSGGIINVSIPDFVIPSGGTWQFVNQCTGTATVTLFPNTFQVSLLSPVNPTVGFITAPVAITNGGTGQVTASAALTALGGASLTASNYFGTNGEAFQTMVSHYATNTYPSSGTATLASFTTTVTASANGFANWPDIGMQFNILTNFQFWLNFTNNSTTASIRPSGNNGFTNQIMTVQYPQDIWYDTTPGGNNVVAYVGSDGTIGTACGTLGKNASGGGYRYEDGPYSMLAIMHAAGGVEGECWSLLSDNNNQGPIVNVSYNAQNYSLNVLPSGLIDCEFGVTNHGGTLLLGGKVNALNGVIIASVGIATLGTATGTITATGYTNILGTNVYVNCIGTAVAVTIKNNAGTPVATNTVVTGGTIIPLQPGGSISAASGLTGTYWVQ